MTPIDLQSAYEWKIKTSKEQQAVYLGDFFSIDGSPHFIGRKSIGNGPIIVTLPASKDPESSEMYLSVSYPPSPDKKHGELSRALQSF